MSHLKNIIKDGKDGQLHNSLSIHDHSTHHGNVNKDKSVLTGMICKISNQLQIVIVQGARAFASPIVKSI